MDKEPTLLLNFIWGISGSVICFLSARYRPRLLWLTGTISVFYFYGLINELRDPYVGRDILREAGKFYVVSGYLLALLVIISIAVGFMMRKRSSKTSASLSGSSNHDNK